MKSLFFLIALSLCSCAVNHFQHTQAAPRKYRRYYQHNQRKNSRHRDSNSYARAAYKGVIPLLWAETDTTRPVKTKEVR